MERSRSSPLLPPSYSSESNRRPGGNESRNTVVKSGMKRRKYQQPVAQSTFSAACKPRIIDELFTQRCPYSAVSNSSCTGGGESMATAIWLSASLVLRATRKYKFTFPIFAVGAILSNFLTITVSLVLDITVPGIRLLVTGTRNSQYSSHLSSGLRERSPRSRRS